MVYDTQVFDIDCLLYVIYELSASRPFCSIERGCFVENLNATTVVDSDCLAYDNDVQNS